MRRAIDFAAAEEGVSLARQVEQASEFLRSRGCEAARVVIAPHRICPLGAHSDHQHGPVLGLGIDLHTVLAFEPQEIPRLVLSSADFPGEVEIDLADGVRTVRDDTGGWGRYALGAVALLRDRLSATPRGLVGRITGALPGGGLSSSASNVVAQLLALSAANALELPAEELVRLAQRVENEFAGVSCGVLDPACVVGARRGGLLRIDTAKLQWQSIPGSAAGLQTRFLVAYSGRSRDLAATAFNRRVAECHAAARRLGALAGLGHVERLGELEDAVFEAHGAALPEPERRRAAHFFGERGRVALGAAHWASGDMESFGALMRESCRSSIELYETGSPELVRLQEIWNESEGVFGARFSGAGFGGCSIALVDAAAADDVAARVSSRFRASFPALADAARVFPVAAADGARVVTLR